MIIENLSLFLLIGICSVLSLSGCRNEERKRIAQDEATNEDVEFLTQALIKDLVISEVDFQESDLSEVYTFIQKVIDEHLTMFGLDEKVVLEVGSKMPDKKITLMVKHISLELLLEVVSFQAGIHYEVLENRIIFSYSASPD